MSISQRALRTPPLPTQRDAARLRMLEQGGIQVWKLHQGDPQFLTPEVVYQELCAYAEKTIAYPGAAGLTEHVEAWKTTYALRGIDTKGLQVIPTCGAAEAIHMALFTVTDPGDEVLVFEPIYSGFSVIASMLDCRFVPILTRFEQNFALPETGVWEEKLTERTKAMILISPDNPTGRVLSRAEIERVAQFANVHNLVLIIDETYRDLVMKTTISPPCALTLTRYRDRIILIDSLSKRAGVPGMRIGAFVTFNTEFKEQALKFAMSRSGTGRIEQKISIPLLVGGEELVIGHRVELQARLEAAITALREIPEIQIFSPQGGMFVIIKVTGVNARALLRFFLEQFRFEAQTVSFLSLQDFYLSPEEGGEDIRIAAVYPPEEMKVAIRIFQKGLEAFRAQ